MSESWCWDFKKKRKERALDRILIVRILFYYKKERERE